MNVASLELCKELFELSGLQTDRRVVNFPDGTKEFTQEEWNALPMKYIDSYFLYDLGYLLRKIQELLPAGEYVAVSRDNDPRGFWCASTSNDHSMGDEAYADTPENAATKLAIELFKQRERNQP